MNYFDKLPTITYNNNLVKNIVARVRLSDSVRSNKSAFYPYTMDAEDRIDTLSNLYYEDPGYTWLIWLANDIVDPYFDVPLNDDDFNDHVATKYGSYDLAARKIKVYRNNWYDNTDVSITPSQFNSLANGTQKYYEPVLDNVLNVARYVRKRDDDIIATNKIQSVAISSVTGTFKVGEEVQTNGTNYAFITYVGATSITVQHITGTLSGTITGQESGATATIPTILINNVPQPDVTTLTQPISAVDAPFWSPVTFLEYEQDLNEAKKVIKLLDVRYTSQAVNDLKRTMSAR
jgi:hypothetical protein